MIQSMEVTDEIQEQNLLNSPPLDIRVLEAVKSCRDLKIKPARLASELGISIEDASAELCGLLRAVGSTATFTFETVGVPTRTEQTNDIEITTTTMVFQFPPDFEQKAQSSRRKEDIQKVLSNILHLAIKIIKVVVAFGLIISLAILLLGGICATVALIIGLSRGGGGGMGGRHNQRLMNQVRSMFFTFRQLLWCYAIFGQGLDQGQDPFLREIAHTLALGLGVLMGSPRSIWFWMNARHLRDRQRQRRRRGWHDRTEGNSSSAGTVLNQGTWGHDLQETRTQKSSLYDQDVGQRGILSIAVEFLFGPTPFQPGPSEFDKWKIREMAIVSLSSSSSQSEADGIILTQLLPYTNYPPPTKSFGDGSLLLSTDAGGRSECLNIVSHFNGVPTCTRTGAKVQRDSSNAHFVFPELISEAVSGNVDVRLPINNEQEEDPSWGSFLFVSDNHLLSERNFTIPTYLMEQRHVLTKLSRKQFGQCCILNILNYIGILMLWKSIEKGGILEIKNVALFGAASTVLSMLKFYARLFFTVPFSRAVVILVLNFRVTKRNEKRRFFAEQLSK